MRARPFIACSHSCFSEQESDSFIHKRSSIIPKLLLSSIQTLNFQIFAKNKDHKKKMLAAFNSYLIYGGRLRYRIRISTRTRPALHQRNRLSEQLNRRIPHLARFLHPKPEISEKAKREKRGEKRTAKGEK